MSAAFLSKAAASFSTSISSLLRAMARNSSALPSISAKGFFEFEIVSHADLRTVSTPYMAIFARGCNSARFVIC